MVAQLGSMSLKLGQNLVLQRVERRLVLPLVLQVRSLQVKGSNNSKLRLQGKTQKRIVKARVVCQSSALLLDRRYIYATK